MKEGKEEEKGERREEWEVGWRERERMKDGEERGREGKRQGREGERFRWEQRRHNISTPLGNIFVGHGTHKHNTYTHISRVVHP